VALAAAGLWAVLAALNAAGAPFGVLCVATVAVYPPLLLALRAVSPADLRLLRGSRATPEPAELRPI
jgi:hypothetical protein